MACFVIPYAWYTMDMRIRVSRSARKHRIGNAHILAAMRGRIPTAVQDDALIFIYPDDRGVELVLVAVPDDRWDAEPGDLTVIHAVKLEYDRRSKS